MKIKLYSWLKSDTEEAVLRAENFEDAQIVEGDPFEITKRLFGRGVNVMLLKARGENPGYDVLIAISGTRGLYLSAPIFFHTIFL
jgi:hypothetical protein